MNITKLQDENATKPRSIMKHQRHEVERFSQQEGGRSRSRALDTRNEDLFSRNVFAPSPRVTETIEQIEEVKRTEEIERHVRKKKDRSRKKGEGHHHHHHHHQHSSSWQQADSGRKVNTSEIEGQQTAVPIGNVFHNDLPEDFDESAPIVEFPPTLPRDGMENVMQNTHSSRSAMDVEDRRRREGNAIRK
ncbi:unnamed protein product [Soboliphyme baturini]|uniref:Uncharacterized protein n=1 Tax=Soboliphyme baturini TaxID=241478 RepID=A0A183ID83_9BILA|nr:unnamed protein product [Soboliphyme baturini]